jgi:thiamine-phosphate pyrophosphorylase
MPGRCLLCYITDRTAFAGDEATRRRRLLEKIAEGVAAGVGFIQLREKDLTTHELELLARDVVRVISETRQPNTRLLINSRTDVAIACGADGVHLRSDDISPQEVRKIWNMADTASRARTTPVVSVSCHTLGEVEQAAKNGADFVVFAPVFEKKDATGAHPAGVDALRKARQLAIPVLALGGVNLENAGHCLDAGAAGIAAIRLFQDNDIATIVRKLRDQ